MRQGRNLLSIVGGKYTTYRVIAQQTVDAAYRLLNAPVKPCRTAEVLLPDHRPPPSGEVLSDAPEVHASDIAHACEHEMVVTLGDVMRRRTSLALSRSGGPETALLVARLMAPMMNWSAEEERVPIQPLRRRMETKPPVTQRPLIIAHRGFSGRYVENTLASVRAALQLGVDLVEIDVQETRDGELIVFHDYRLDESVARVAACATKLWPNPGIEPAGADVAAGVVRLRGRARVLDRDQTGRPRQGRGADCREPLRMEHEVIVFSLSIPRIRRLLWPVHGFRVLGWWRAIWGSRWPG